MQNLLEVKNLKMHFPAGSEGLFGRKKNYIYAVDGIDFNLKKAKRSAWSESPAAENRPLRAQLPNYINRPPVPCFLTAKILQR